MRYDYRELLKAKEEMDKGISRLKEEKQNTYEKKVKTLEEKLLTSGIIEEYCDLVNLLDNVHSPGHKGPYKRYEYEGVTFCVDNTWVRSKNYIGLIYSYGSCGDHSDTLILDMKRSRELNKIVWFWKNGTADRYSEKPTITSGPRNSNQQDACSKKIRVLEVILIYFDKFRENILDGFNAEMEYKAKEIEKLAKEKAKLEGC